YFRLGPSGRHDPLRGDPRNHPTTSAATAAMAAAIQMQRFAEFSSGLSNMFVDVCRLASSHWPLSLTIVALQRPGSVNFPRRPRSYVSVELPQAMPVFGPWSRVSSPDSQAEGHVLTH